MVRVNIVLPKKLADQHLIAEYNEILMLFGYVRKNPSATNIPSSYRLGKGHMMFFKDKLLYLKERHELIKKEMIKRNFITNKTISLSDFSSNLVNTWKPSHADYNIIKKRLSEKLLQKPAWYRYYGEVKSPSFLINLLK